MKKVAFIFVLFTTSSLIAAANSEVTSGPGDPQKQQQQAPTFNLSKGYFSLFNIFTSAPAKPDTTRINIVLPVNETPYKKD
jgi:hypothetical protein